MERVVERDNLRKALRQVQRNQGAPGVDGMTVENLAVYLKDRWPEIRAQLLAGAYRPCRRGGARSRRRRAAHGRSASQRRSTG